jgi:hypothetical protein
MGDFWQDQTAWPRDTQERVFLGQLNQLGRALFGEDWTGEEPGIKTFSYFKIVTDSRATNNFIARYLPQFGRREYHGSMAPPPTGYDDHRLKFEFSKNELDELKIFLDRHNAAVPPAKARYKEVQGKIADDAVAGKLGTFFRALTGGEFNPIPSHWWNTERLEQRFASCRINPDAPFGPGGAAWIFVSRRDLDIWLEVGRSQNFRPPQRRGRPPKYDWDRAKQFAFDELETNGDFEDPLNQTADWRVQNDLVVRVQKYLGKYYEDEPSDSGTKERVKDFLLEWRAGQKIDR